MRFPLDLILKVLCLLLEPVYLYEHVFKEIKLAVAMVLVVERTATRVTKDAPVACLSLLTSACFGPSTCCGQYFTIAGAHREKPAGHV